MLPPPTSAPKKPATAIPQAIKEALEINPRVWLYPVSSFNGKKEGVTRKVWTIPQTELKLASKKPRQTIVEITGKL